MLELNGVDSHCEGPAVAPPVTAIDWRAEWDDRAERMNRTLAELARAMMFGTSVPVHLWPEAMRHAAYLRNRTHTWALEGQTPLERWSGTRPNVAHLHEFGGPVWILNEGPNQSKLVPKSSQHTFMGFEDSPKAIRYYDARTRLVRVLRNFRFTDLSANATPANKAPVHTESVQSEGSVCRRKMNLIKESGVRMNQLKPPEGVLTQG